MTDSVYHVAIIGAGVTGAAIAQRLSRYNIAIAVLERYTDISFGVSKANSGIIHAGFHHKPELLKSQLEIKGNGMFDTLKEQLNFPFKRVGILVIAFSYDEMKVLNTLYNQGIENNVPGIELCSREKTLNLEPKLNKDVAGSLYAPSGGIIEPYRFVFALMESARKNGVRLYTNFCVERVEKHNEIYTLYSTYNQKIQAHYVINAAGLYADDISKLFDAEIFTILPRKGEEYILEKNAAGFPNHVIFPVPTKNSKGTLVIPTVEGTMMIGPTAQDVEDKEDVSTSQENLDNVFSLAMHMVPSISKKEIITSFAGLRPALKGNDFYIDISKKASHLIQVAGIQSPGLTASPAIALYVEDLLVKDGLKLSEKSSYDPYIPKSQRVRECSLPKIKKLIEKDKSMGNIVCRCELVSEAEIMEAIKSGHTTIDGIKFYTRAGMGRCQGGFCTYKIMKILIRETGMCPREITKRGAGSFLIHGTLSPDNIKEDT
ncbi:MAG: FAD-dependent oxidoreductase [Spirochaetales bacterium]|nr:FAD-dependent oxidoreductase [Spirochaetales bacterium]